MSRMLPILYRAQKGSIRKSFNWNIEPPITKQSGVVMSAAEAKVTPGILGAEDGSDLHLGDVDVGVTNVPPYADGVEFILHAKWDASWT